MGFCKFSKFGLLFLIVVVFLVSGKQEKAQALDNDQASLVSFMSGIVSDPKRALENWNSSSVHVCNWTGVKCNGTRKVRVVEIDLSGFSLRGTISPAISNLSHLKILDLSENFFEGNIPAELGSLFYLQQLSLSLNLLHGNIPVEIGSLHQLVYINLGSNHLSGEIPISVFCSSSLKYIDFSNNSLSGKIPLQNQCELRELRYLLLWSNQFSGHVPLALSNSSKLEWLDLESNSLSGELPLQIFNKMPRLQFLYLSYNHFSSHAGNTNLRPFFSSLVNCSNLQELELAGNSLGGELPSIIGDLSTNLVQLHLDENRIYGAIPPTISNLFNLTLLNLSSNLLNSSIPSELCRMERLERLYLSDNLLFGEIPSAFGENTHLGLLDLSKNKLSGSIPDSFANLPQLRRLLLYQNHLSGTIPPSLGKCINLEILDLSHNRISGMIPNEVAGLSSLKLYVNLSSNDLQGPIPLELSKMDMVLAIDLSSNNLSGSIPSQLGGCIALEYLNLSSNDLQGPLPELVAQLSYIKVLDVSKNQLIGEIPRSLQASSTLKQLNLSFNNFSGNVSREGSFSSLTINSFLGNHCLCGSIEGMISCKRKRIHHAVKLPILLSVLITTPILCIFAYPIFVRSKMRRKMSIYNGGDAEDEEEEQEKKELKYPRISYRQLTEATGGFSSSSLIGSGGFGHVYKGVLEDNRRIAVKVLDTRTAGEFSGSSFKRECEVLRRTRHRNLIKIITICSRPDFKALVLPLMPNGSLENQLYPNHGLRHSLDLVQLVSICSDVAEGMAYLHHYSPVKVVHCDLKPSNILLDDDMTALVTDFGIARLGKASDKDTPSNDSASFSSTHGLLCGSVGYIAPEYGMGKSASTHGDVYSFGVLLLEIVAGKRPTDVLFNEGSSLHEWVKSHYPHKLEPIVESALTMYATSGCHWEAAQKKLWSDVILELIELGLVCTQYNPSTRPTMLDVAQEMSRLKQFISCRPNSSLPIEEASSRFNS